MEKNVKYSIKNLSKKQIRVISKSLEAYCRLGLLQFDTVLNDVINWNRIGNKNDKISESYIKNREQIEYHLSEIKKLIVSEDEELRKYGGGHWSIGIGSDKNTIETHIAYELEKDINKIVFDDKRSKLRFTEEEDIIVEEDNLRIEKILKIIEKRKKNKF